MDISPSLNLAGLVTTTVAAALMFYFPPRVASYTQNGEPYVSWIGSVVEGKKRSGKLQLTLSKLSPLILCIGFGLQLIALLVPAEPAALPLACKGSVTILNQNGTQVIENAEEIAVSIKGSLINFSGNRYIGGESIKICPPGPITKSIDQPYFDSSSCETKLSSQSARRTYGTVNKITGTVTITESVNENGVVFVRGDFKCVKVLPISG